MKKDISGRIVTIEYDPNRNACICLIHYGDGEKRYILHPRGAIIGDTIVSGTEVPISMGNALPLSATDVKKGFHSVNRRLNIAITRVTKPYGQPNILAEYIALQLKNRVSFRKAMKRAIELTEQADTKGIQVQIGGRIDGKEIARVEWVREGRVPLQTIRAKIDHCSYPVRTIYGTHLNVSDNSGARELMCIRILGASNRRYAHIGDVIVAVIKEAVPNMPLQRSEVIRAVIVRTCKELKRDNGMIIRYDDNAAVVIDQEGNPKGTRVLERSLGN
ncbi:hypothetical protein H6P81_021435 [Aristolochia fimbriata]|uniref:Large ribosomal subunit protein uL2 RNA-binding domain-containing protein n=1 Tax=Aristolochia fimbriata TaxID=158543 RepID=A0AAV7DTL1_ARIFI|nr:hypothetical protein H6P81_021435 [Aristolochia fimbriata]